MLSITHHRAIDIVRRRRSVSTLPETETVHESLRVPDVWAEVVRAADRDAVRRAIAELPAGQRQAIEMAYFDGLTQVEIADRAGIPLGTVKGRVRLGLAQLRRLLEGPTQ
jgi:RNA polymerase sigma-70 factor (ECF subfamily)